MAYVAPTLQPRLDALSPELRSAVLAREKPLRTLYDLIAVLGDLVRESED